MRSGDHEVITHMHRDYQLIKIERGHPKSSRGSDMSMDSEVGGGGGGGVLARHSTDCVCNCR